MLVELLRWSIGFLFILLLVAPLGTYHHNVESVSGTLWGYMMPVGYVAAVGGLNIVFYSRSGISRKLGLPRLLIIIGFLVMSAHIAQSPFRELFIGAWTGVSGNYDIDFYSTIMSFSVLVSFLAVSLGLFQGFWKGRL